MERNQIQIPDSVDRVPASSSEELRNEIARVEYQFNPLKRRKWREARFKSPIQSIEYQLHPLKFKVLGGTLFLAFLACVKYGRRECEYYGEGDPSHRYNALAAEEYGHFATKYCKTDHDKLRVRTFSLIWLLSPLRL